MIPKLFISLREAFFPHAPQTERLEQDTRDVDMAALLYIRKTRA